MTGTENIARMAKISNAHKIFVENLKKLDGTEEVGVNGRITMGKAINKRGCGLD